MDEKTEAQRAQHQGVRTAETECDLNPGCWTSKSDLKTLSRYEYLPKYFRKKFNKQKTK